NDADSTALGYIAVRDQRSMEPRLQNLPLIRHMAKEGCDINAQHRLVRTLLSTHTLFHLAVHWNDPNGIHQLTAMGANPNIQDDLGRTPLFLSAHPTVLKELLKVPGIDLSIRDNIGRTYPEELRAELAEL